jgi:hypothetical protein
VTTTPAPAFHYDDGVLERSGERWQLGQQGDRVVLGDWDCDGAATPAVLRPSSGDVFVFTAWVTGGEVQVPPITRVVGAVTARVQDASARCTTLLVRRADGTQVPVTTERSA